MTDAAQPNADTQGAETQDRTAGSHDAPVNLTQAQINSIVANEMRKVEQRFSDYDTLKQKAARLDELEAAKLSEIERLQLTLAEKDAAIAQAQQEAAAERLNALRLRVGQELGLSPLQSARLQGADEAEIRADAEAVRADLGKTAQPPTIPDLNPGAGGDRPRQVSTTLTDGERLAARAANMTEAEYMAAKQSMEAARGKDA